MKIYREVSELLDDIDAQEARWKEIKKSKGAFELMAGMTSVVVTLFFMFALYAVSGAWKRND